MSSMTAEELRAYRRQKMQEYRARMDPAERERLNAERARKAREKRAAETPEEKAARAEKERQRKRDRNLKQKTAQDLAEKNIDTPFPADAIIAAAVNAKHGITTVEAESRSHNHYCIVERVYIGGTSVHRTKTVTYEYYKNKADAITAAKSHSQAFLYVY
ncbi:MAG: hypothetical protein K6C12_12035 [Oscillospiraceae bacterium]|nr:hypothetical protein [Oscillospiraceae bacterium]